MKNKDDRSEVTVPLESSGQALRRQAEEIAREKAAQSTENHEAEALLPKKTRQMLHELRVHQIELEMQNEELQRSREELEEMRDHPVHLSLVSQSVKLPLFPPCFSSNLTSVIVIPLSTALHIS